VQLAGAYNVQARFNLIMNNTFGVQGGYNDDFRLNWWGDPTGPYEPANNPNGLGDKIQGNIIFSPWLTAPPSVALSASGSNEMLKFSEVGVNVYISGSAKIYVAEYSSNPGAELANGIGKYVDIHIPDFSALNSIELRVYYIDEDVAALGLEENSLRMYWWNGGTWLLCSNTGVNTSENYVWAVIGNNTSPSLSNLAGTPFSQLVNLLYQSAA